MSELNPETDAQRNTIYLVYVSMSYIPITEGHFVEHLKAFPYLRGAQRHFLYLQERYANTAPTLDATVVMKPLPI